MSGLTLIDPSALLKIANDAESKYAKDNLSDEIQRNTPQLFIPESSAQGYKSENSAAISLKKDNREEGSEAEQDGQELKLFVEKAFTMVEQREFARDAIDQMIARISNASGTLRDQMQNILDKMRFRDDELRQQEERKKEEVEEVKYDFNINFSDAADDIKKAAFYYFKELQAGMNFVGALVQNYFDADGNEVKEMSDKAEIMKFDREDMNDVKHSMNRTFSIFEAMGLAVETKEYNKVDSQGNNQSATAFAVRFFEGFSVVNIQSITQEEVELALVMKQQGAKISSENAVKGVFGSMEGNELASVLRNFSETITKKNSVEEVSTKFRDMVGKPKIDNDHSTFAERFGSKSNNSDGRY